MVFYNNLLHNQIFYPLPTARSSMLIFGNKAFRSKLQQALYKDTFTG